MTALDGHHAGRSASSGWSTRSRSGSRPVNRRSFLVGAAVAGSALATNPRLRPAPVSRLRHGLRSRQHCRQRLDGLLRTINKGVNACPPGSFAAGWWKADDSSWCGGGSATSSTATRPARSARPAARDGICDRGCWSCCCGHGLDRDLRPAAGLLQRLPLRPVQHPREVQRRRALPGGQLRAAVPVGQLHHDLVAATTGPSEHSAPCIRSRGRSPRSTRRWATRLVPQGVHRPGAGDRRRPRAATSPYQGGRSTGPPTPERMALSSFVRSQYRQGRRGPGGPLGYPTSDVSGASRTAAGSSSSRAARSPTAPAPPPRRSRAPRTTVWRANSRERRRAGLPHAATVFGRRRRRLDPALPEGRHRRQRQHGPPRSSGAPRGPSGRPTGARPAAGLPHLRDHVRPPRWRPGSSSSRRAPSSTAPAPPPRSSGAPRGRSGRPTGARPACWATPPPPSPSAAPMAAGSSSSRRAPSSTAPARPPRSCWGGCSTPGRPRNARAGCSATRRTGLTGDGRGESQAFQKGGLWALGSGPARRVYGAVLDEWKAEGGAGGRYGYPLTRHGRDARWPAHVRVRGRHHHRLRVRTWSPPTWRLRRCAVVPLSGACRNGRAPTGRRSTMTVVSEMLRTHPTGVGDTDETILKNCILACLECFYSCTACADACLAEPSVADLRGCIRTDLDYCADVCDATARVLRGTPDRRATSSGACSRPAATSAGPAPTSASATPRCTFIARSAR